ncbi:MAG TPA: hypothetical protein VES19_11055 [Candidatus Limnocylindrales bacterium]|nr:hypothetical protein [Candidatus Limnocylindrales bacterium]
MACLLVAPASPVTVSARAVPGGLAEVVGATHRSAWHVEPPIELVIWAAWPHVWCEPADASWHAENVAIRCTALDIGAGLVDPADAELTLSTGVPDGAADANASTGTHLICNAAGNCRNAGPISGIRVDRAGPEIRATVDPPAGPYLPGAMVQVTFTCTDTASGVRSCPSVATLDTTSPGTYAASFAAGDEAGNLSSVSVDYTVQPAGIAPMMIVPDARGRLI